MYLEKKLSISEIINIDKMNCSHCVLSVTNIIKEIKGVTKLEVSLENKNATIVFDETITDIKTISAAVIAGGFPVFNL